MNEQNEGRKLKTSRILKYTLIVIVTLTILWLISTSIITFLTCKAMEVGIDENVRNMVETVCGFIKIDISGAIGAIATAVVARYGIREATANIAKKDYNTNID